MSISIVYKDISPGATENSITTATFQTQYSDLSRFKDSLQNENYGTFENDFWLLDGSFSVLPDNESDMNISCWSENIGSNTGEVSDTSKTIAREYIGYYTSSGITLTFDTFNNEYPESITVQWLKDGEVLSEQNYTVDSAVFYCENSVEKYNKIIIVFNTLLKNIHLRVTTIENGTS